MTIEMENPPQRSKPPRHSGDEGGNGRGKIDTTMAAPATDATPTTPAISRRTRRITIAGGLIILALIILAIVIVAGQISAKTAAAAEAKAGMTPPPAPAARVAVLQLQGIPFEDKLTLPGALMPWRQVNISSETKGPVAGKMIEEGQIVEQGQVLFKIDIDTLQTELELAQSRLALAEKQAERTRLLFAQSFAPQDKLDEDESAVEQDRANVRLKRLMLDKATIEAPISGVVNRVSVEAGDYVREGDPLCEIIQTNQLKMVVGVPEKDIVFLSEGQSVPVRVDALAARGQEPLSGSILKIIPAADMDTHTFTVEVAIAQPGELARPGMIGRAELTRRRLESAILIPIFAVTRHSEGYAVFVEREGKAERRIITIGSFLPQGLQIETGLAPGDNLIIRGQRDLMDGESVDTVRRIGPEVFDLAEKLGTSLSNSDIENFLDDYMNEPAGLDAAGDGTAAAERAQ